MKAILQSAGRMTLVVGLVLLLGAPMVLAQESPASCESLILTNLTSAASACADLENNTACYGGATVSGTFFTPSSGDVFEEPGDRVGIANLSELITDPAQATDGVWGVASQHVQAGLPAALTDGWLVMIPVGGISIENAVEPDAAFVPLDEPVDVTTTRDAELRVATLALPATSEVLGTLASGETVPADAQSTDGLWVRVVYENQPAWVSADALEDPSVVDTLPAIGTESFGSMQSFSISGASNADPCGEVAPSLLFVQSSKDYPVDVRISGANIQIHGAVSFQVIDNNLQMAVLDGLATIEPGSEEPILVPGGYFSQAPLEDDEPAAKRLSAKTTVTGTWSEPEPFLDPQQIAYARVLRIPTNIIKWPLIIAIVIRPSGVGNPQIQIIARELTLRLVQRACDADRLPQSVCQIFGF